MASLVYEQNSDTDAMLDSLQTAKERAQAADEIKETGNSYFMAKELGSALACYSKAIELNSTNHIFYSNRAMCNIAMGDSESALEDAINCLKIKSDFIKGYFHKANAEIGLGFYDDADKTIAIGMKFEEDQQKINKDNNDDDPKTISKTPIKKSNFDRLLKTLKNKRINDKTNGTEVIKPSIKHFEIGQELGIGNFSRIVIGIHKETNIKYALKMIEKQEVDRMKKRHPNIHNEISMEKRVLAKFNNDYFPGVVKMFNTFQDYYCLYYQMEYMEAGELWSKLSDVSSGGSLVGAYSSLATRWIAEIVLAIEYIHSKGIVHRDLKPENIMITNDGHIKIIDFGTAKDLIDTDLNGPEFVGTPEYMAPEMVTGNGLIAYYSVDIWSLGIITYQLLLGYTPFKAPSPYLTFLLIKKCHIFYPKNLLNSQIDFISKCLKINPKERLGEPDLNPGNLIKMKKHILFHNIFFFNDMKEENEENDNQNNNKKVEKEDVRNKLFDILPNKIPLLSELCLRKLASKMINNKTKDKNILTLLSPQPSITSSEESNSESHSESFENNKMTYKNKNLQSLYQLKHILERMLKINEPRILRSFYFSLNDYRCLRARFDRKDYIGLTHLEQGHWKENFIFVHINVSYFLTNFMKSNPISFNTTTTSATAPSPSLEKAAENDNNETENDLLFEETVKDMKLVVSCLNRLRPKVCVVCGDFANTPEHVIEIFRSQISRISESIPLCFVSTASNIDRTTTLSSSSSSQNENENKINFNSNDQNESNDLYGTKFGSDYYGFWYGGMRALVLNSSLLMYDNNTSDSSPMLAQKSLEQEAWFDGEVEQGQLGGHHVVVFNFHPWFFKNPLNEDKEEGDNIVPLCPRLKWMRKLYEGNVHAVFTTTTCDGHNSSHVIKPKQFKEVLMAAGKIYDDEATEDDGMMMRQSQGPEERFMEFITTSSSSSSSSSLGFRIVSVFEHQMVHKFYALNDIPDRVELLKEPAPNYH